MIRYIIQKTKNLKMEKPAWIKEQKNAEDFEIMRK